MSEKKDQQRTIDEIKRIVDLLGEERDLMLTQAPARGP